MKSTIIPAIVIATCVWSAAAAQSWHNGDISWLRSEDFASNVMKWKSDAEHRLSGDDNFFISRVKPRMRFVNAATQVRTELVSGVNDKRLMAWLPVNVNHDGNRNALPTGEFDSECFTMWSYVDHWGNWSAPFGALPGNFTDVAHKNGVTVSSLAPVPWGRITPEWDKALSEVAALDADCVADMLVYYGHDGLGYNSEFQPFAAGEKLRDMHARLTAGINRRYSNVTPGYDMAETVWYDGTNDAGMIQYDYGLDKHNIASWGRRGEERSSLFFNYNWHLNDVLPLSVANADTLGGGRSPLYLYAGVNMQGGQPCGTPDEIWGQLKRHNISIGLWGAHDQNMFWQGRNEAGSSAEARQQRYQHRLENWFTGGSHNPVNDLTPAGIVLCSGDDREFMGMANMMSARSALKWNLDDEPFYTHFNVGNGRFFNFRGQRRNDCEWYNIGVQDYMPTWRWWWTDEFLGRTPLSTASDDLKARFTWQDAWMGGSCLEIEGSGHDKYLHLFKTSYPLQAGDIIKVRYKLVNGNAAVSLVCSVEGAESKVATAYPFVTALSAPKDEWVERVFTVQPGDALGGKTLAMLALEFAKADAMQLRLGEISIKRRDAVVPAAPVIERAEVLRNSYKGIDGKLIFSMPNDIEGSGSVCYNSDVNVGLFALYVQQEGKSPVMYGLTPSWAAMYYGAPYIGDARSRVRFGVSALSLDLQAESAIAWSEYMHVPADRLYSDEVQISKRVITPKEAFALRTVDPQRRFVWELYKSGDRSKPVATSRKAVSHWQVNGLGDCGAYDLVLRGANCNDSAPDAEICHKSYLSVTPVECGREPEIKRVVAKSCLKRVEAGSPVEIGYTCRPSDGRVSRGLAIDEKSFGVKVSEVLDSVNQSFSIAGWLKVDEYNGNVNWIDIVDRGGKWPVNNWGWMWSSLRPDGSLQQLDHFFAAPLGVADKQVSYKYDEKESIFPKGNWTHFAMTFERDSVHTRTKVYINGKALHSTWIMTSEEDAAIREEGADSVSVRAHSALGLDNMIMLGGTRHLGRGVGGNSFKGVLDDFQIWNKSMTQADVLQSMNGLQADCLPEGVAAYWDFEEDADADHMFIARGSRAGAKAGYFRMIADTSAEGRGKPEYHQPRFTSGAPYIPAGSYEVRSSPLWTGGGVRCVETTATPAGGTSKLVWDIPGEYTLTLTLRNDHGSDIRQVGRIKVEPKTHR